MSDALDRDEDNSYEGPDVETSSNGTSLGDVNGDPLDSDNGQLSSDGPEFEDEQDGAYADASLDGTNDDTSLSGTADTSSQTDTYGDGGQGGVSSDTYSDGSQVGVSGDASQTDASGAYGDGSQSDGSGVGYDSPAGGDQATEDQLTADNAAEQDTIDALDDDPA